jgi:uncharacterized membrane protein
VDDFDLYRLFKTLHVISVVVLGGGFVLEALCGMMVARARTVQEVRAYARLMAFSENILSPVAAVALAIFGYLTADRIGFPLDLTWLALGQLMFYAIVILAIVILRPAANELKRLAEAAPDGPVTGEINARLKKPLPTIVGPLTSVAFAFVIYLMVSKPAW